MLPVEERFSNPSLSMDILQAFEAYAEHMRGLRNFSPVTLRERRGKIRFFVATTGTIDLGAVTQETAQSYLLRGRIERNWSSSTFLTHHKHLSVFYAWCQKKGLVSENPFANIEKPRQERRLPRRLTCNEAKCLLEACRTMPCRGRFQRLRRLAIVALMLYTGLRRSEVLKLQIRHVDLDGGSLQVIQGKGGKDRFLPLNPQLEPILRAYLAARAACRADGNPYFFISVEPGKPLSERGIRRLFDKLKAYTGLDFSPHALRHTFATLMLEGGCDIFSLSQLMGHSKITTTAIYLAASSGLLARSIAKHPLDVRSPA